MNRLPGASLLLVLCVLTPSSANATSIDSTLESGSLSEDIRRILESPETAETPETSGDLTSPRDPSLDFYYSRLGAYGAGDPLYDRGAPARPRGSDDSSATKKKPPKHNEISEPYAAWLFVAGALGLFAFGRRRRAR